MYISKYEEEVVAVKLDCSDSLPEFLDDNGKRIFPDWLKNAWYVESYKKETGDGCIVIVKRNLENKEDTSFDIYGHGDYLLWRGRNSRVVGMRASEFEEIYTEKENN